MFIQDIDLKLKDWAFAQRKGLPYQLKLQLTERRIRDWSDYWGGDVYVSFSGGLDSTVLLHFVRKVLGDKVPAVFCNTGLEYPELVEFVKTFGNVEIIRPKMSFREVLKTYGYPIVSKETAAKIRKLRHGKLGDRYKNYLLHGDERGKTGKLAECWKILLDAPFETSEKCCDVMKKKPFHEYHRRTGRYPFIGITQDEGYQRQRQYEKTGCNIYDGDRPKSQPLGFWTKQDILIYALTNDLSICSVYDDIIEKDTGRKASKLKLRLLLKYRRPIPELRTKGVERTGCIFCAFGCHLEECPNRFQRMETSHPQLYEYCMRDWEKGGLGLGKVLDYINVPYMNNVDAISSNGTKYQQFKMM